MAKSDQETIRHWQKHVEEFKLSGLTRVAYSERNGIPVYQLDYWRRRFSRISANPVERRAEPCWVPLTIADNPIEKDSRIDLWIGRVRVEIKHGFDSRLLAEVLRTMGAAC
jgi:hypothetical protein